CARGLRRVVAAIDYW
nr:immunoglobulin heavy chain junction region [Macaca mulatta]